MNDLMESLDRHLKDGSKPATGDIEPPTMASKGPSFSSYDEVEEAMAKRRRGAKASLHGEEACRVRASLSRVIVINSTDDLQIICKSVVRNLGFDLFHYRFDLTCDNLLYFTQYLRIKEKNCHPISKRDCATIQPNKSNRNAFINEQNPEAVY